jgi:hypothetical protein
MYCNFPLSLRKYWVLFLLTLSGLAYIIYIDIRQEIPTSVVVTLAGISILLSSIALRKPLNEVERKLLIVALGGSLLVIVLICWNFLFHDYVVTNKYTQDIFRRAFHNRLAPIYPIHISNPLKVHNGWHEQTSWVFLLIPFVSVFIVRIFFWSNAWIEDRKFWFELLMWFTGLILLFSLTNSPIRLTDKFAGYYGFYKNLYIWGSLGDILPNYNQQLQNLFGRTAHYPPGNLFLIKFGFQVLGITWFTHTIVILCTILTLIPLIGIASELDISIYTKHIALALYISSPSILLFPSHYLTPIPMFLTATAIWLTLRAIRQESILLSIAIGCLMAILTFFSFVSFIVGGFIILIALGQISLNKVRLSTHVQNACIAILAFLLSYLIVYLLTGFNIGECFLKGLEHNRSSMGTGVDTFVRYMFRSTGNLIAWFCSIGFTGAVFGILAGWNLLPFQRREKKDKAQALTIAVIIAVFLAGFSTLFFLETERIWLFFVPPWLILAAIALSNKITEKNKGCLLKSILIFSILMTISIELFYLPHWSFYYVPY